MQAIEGFWEDAVVLARSEAEHRFRIEEEDFRERNLGHCMRIADVKVGDYVMCQRGDFSKVESVLSQVREIEAWRRVEAGEAPLLEMLRVDATAGEGLFAEEEDRWNVERGSLVTYCTPAVEVLTDPVFMNGERVLREEGMDAYEEEYARLVKKGFPLVSHISLSAYRGIEHEGITLFRYDYEAATDLSEIGVEGADLEDIECCVRNLGMKPALQKFKPIAKAVERVPAGSLRAYALITEQGTYVVDGLFAKSPEK